MSEVKKEFGVYEPFEGVVGYHIEKCNKPNCRKCKFAIRGKRKFLWWFFGHKYYCKWGLNKK